MKLSSNTLSSYQSEDPVAKLLDSSLAGVVAALGVCGILRIGSSMYPNSLSFFDFDPDALKGIWEILEALGLTAGASRAAYWLWRKLSGKDKYFRAIWRTLDESPSPLTKSTIKARATRILLDLPPADPDPSVKSHPARLDAKEDEKFEATWEEMRQKKVVIKVQGESDEPKYDLGSDWIRKE